MNKVVTNRMFADITGTELFYKYKNIRLYRLVKGDHYLTYWVSILLLDDTKETYSGKWLPCVDIRTLPGFDENKVSIITLIKEPEKIIPKLYRNAVKQNLFKEDMFIPWKEGESEENYIIDEI